jgi:hypothetical protein
MVTPRTGRPEGRPKALLNQDPDRHVLAVADAFHMALGVSAHKARALAVLELFAEKAEFSGESSDKMRAALERFGGTIVSYDISAIRGDVIEERDLEKVLPKVGVLRKKANRRYVTEADINYRTVMASIFFLALFEEGSFVIRAFQIHLLSRKIDEEQMAAALIEAMRIAEGLQ